jgi:hypothetical protein
MGLAILKPRSIFFIHFRRGHPLFIMMDSPLCLEFPCVTCSDFGGSTMRRYLLLNYMEARQKQIQSILRYFNLDIILGYLHLT